MPLTKLFQRRHSNQKDRKKSLTSAESVAEDSNATQDLASGCSKEESKNSAAFEETEESPNIEPELDDRNDSETSRRGSDPLTGDLMEQVRNKSRSLSLKESGTKPNVLRTRRRKCESESAAFSSTDDEGFEDKIIQLRERDLEKVIGQCVDRLIRESILTAVKSVKVDSLYEDVIQSLSRSASESSESSGAPETVEQKLHTDSVTEYADLKMVHTFEEERLEDEADSSEQQTGSEPSSEISKDIRSENDNKDGTEIEESLTRTESDSASKDKTADPEASFETTESEDGPNLVAKADSNVNDSVKSVENGETSTSRNQNENIVADVQIGGSNHRDPFAESDKNDDFQENGAQERTKEVKDCQENNVPTEILDEIELNETAEDTMDCPRPKDIHPFCIENNEEVKGLKNDETDSMKTEAEESKSVSMEGYHADIEESISLHSVASELSFENSKDSKDYSRTTSDDTMASADDNGDKKDTDDSHSEPAKAGKNLDIEANLMAMSGDDFSYLLASESVVEEPSTPGGDLGENLPEQKPVEEEKKVNWKVGYLHVKLPHKSRHKGLKVWKKRCVAIHPDEFAGDDSDPCLVLSVYSGDSSAAKKHSATFWKSVSCQKAVIYRSSSRTHPYAFTISDDKKAVIHLAADSEAVAQEWMAAARAVLWPPSPVVQLEKMLNGREFEISIIDNEFSYHAGLLGMYGYLTITSKKLILVHPQQGFVIQEWYLNTIDKFQLIPQTRIEDVNKVLSMTTCSDSSTGRGDLLIFCREAVSLLQAVAATIHQILTQHSRQEGGKYQKELEEIGEWLVADSSATMEDYYKVPPRQVKSLLDIPNFIFNKPITPGVTMETQKSVPDATTPDDFLNCSITSFVVGGGRFPGKSSDSELSDAYTPPRSPEVKSRREASGATTKA